MKNKGKFILFEGISGSGKTTQAQIFSKILKASYFKEPPHKGDFSFVRELVTKKNLDPLTEFFLFLSQRRYIYLEIEKVLKKGKNVILERSFPSSYVYQFDLGKLKKIISFEEFSLIDKRARNFLDPDKIFIFDIDPKIALKRIKLGKHKYEKLKVLEKARKSYLNYAKKFSWIIINANKDLSQVTEEVLKFF